MENASICFTPMVAGKQFTTNESETLLNPTLFRRLIGALQYITNTRLGISFLVNMLSRFLNNPTLKHYQVSKRILRYHKGTLDFSLQL